MPATRLAVVRDGRAMTSQSWGALVGAWVEWMRASGAPETTIGLRRYYVTRLCAAEPDVLSVTVDTLAAWLGSSGWSPNTKKSARSALRAFYGWLVITGRLETSPAHLLPAVRIPRGHPKPTPDAAFRRALIDSTPRARLAVRLAGQCGLRRGEVARVRGSDVQADLLGWSLRVVGKGGHVRIVPLPDDLGDELHALGDAWAFPSPRGGHLTPHHLAKITTAALGGAASMHSLRHRAATVAYAGTRDLRAVQELLGHSRPETTAGYVQIPDDAIRAAMRAAAA